MPQRPKDNPLGNQPVLPPPSGAGAERAARLFRQLVALQRDPEALPEPSLTNAGSARPNSPDPRPNPESFGGGRRYNQALALVEAIAAGAATPERVPREPQGEAGSEVLPLATESEGPQREAPGQVQAKPDPTFVEPKVNPSRFTGQSHRTALDEALGPRSPPRSPPPGAPTVRPSLAKDPPPVGDQIDPRQLLQETARGVTVIEEPGGGVSFEIAFKDEVFSDLACRITSREGVVTAVFRVQDTNTRRLLTAEAGRLRTKLEAKGLKVQAIEVEVAPP